MKFVAAGRYVVFGSGLDCISDYFLKVRNRGCRCWERERVEE